MATLSTRNFNRWTINSNRGSNNNCVPSIIATFLNIDTKDAEVKMEGYPARTGRKYGGTRIVWNNPASQIARSFGVPATDVVDCSTNTGYSLTKHGTTAQLAKTLTEGAYVIIHKGHAYGMLVVDGIAYTVDYGKNNAARRIVWTATRLDSVDAREVLARFQGTKPNHFERVEDIRPRVEKRVREAYKSLDRIQARKAAASGKELFTVKGAVYTDRKAAAAALGCSVGRIAELVRDARLANGFLNKIVKGQQVIVTC